MMLAVGASERDINGANAGQVRAFQFVSKNWQQVGEDIYEEAGDEFGSSVALSADGAILAVGAIYNYGNGSRAGHVRLFQLTPSKDWIQVGEDIEREFKKDLSGVSIDVSADGATAAVIVEDGNSDNDNTRRAQFIDMSVLNDGDINGRHPLLLGKICTDHFHCRFS
mmetsp:Transcript_27927/g.46301  ORF Transcript_27927/g.46301 Transcript_27927/m.46301 type:complete len:167 (+) Transcript_27927:2094-2594(+)